MTNWERAKRLLDEHPDHAIEAVVNRREAIVIISPNPSFLSHTDALVVFKDDDSTVRLEEIEVTDHELRIDSPRTTVVLGTKSQFDLAIPVAIPISKDGV